MNRLNISIFCTLILICEYSHKHAYAQTGKLQGRAEVNFRYGQERSITMTEFWVPIIQNDTSVLYGNLRIMGDNQDNREGNIGIGYRTIKEKFDGVIGGHIWIDRRKTTRNSKFNQVTIGAEYLGNSIDFLVNAYVPLSSPREISVPNTNPQGAAMAGTGIVVDTDGTIIEEPQAGFDIELGIELGQYFKPIEKYTDSFRIYGGGYYFDGDNTQNVAGLRARFKADISSDIQVGGRFQRDDERGSQGFLEVTIRFPFGQKKKYRKQGLYARLDDSPERDIDIVTSETVIDSGKRVAVINNITGQKQEVLHVDNTAASGGDGSVENPFNTLNAAQAAASAQTIIYVNRGDGTALGQNTGISLSKKGQRLIGSGVNFIYDNGLFTTANGLLPKYLLIAPATTAPIISNVNVASDAVTVTADNVVIAGITVDGATRDGIVVRASGAGASAQNVTITDVTAQNNRIGIYIHGTNDGASSVKIQRAITTANAQHGIAVYDDTNNSFEVDLGGGSLGSAGNNILAGNTLEDLAVEYDGRTLSAKNNWWGQATGADIDSPNIGIAPQIYYGAPVNDGLIGNWTFDDEWTTNTTIYDRSGQGNDGTLLGGVSLADQVAGQNRQALDFDGVNDYAQLPTVSNALSMIMSVNISSAQWGSWNYLLDARGGLPNGWFANNSIGAGWTSMSVDTNITAVDWANIPKDQFARIYLQPNTVFSDNINLMSRVSNNESLSGILDDVRLYDRALSASEISELYRMDTSSSVDISSFLTATP